MAWSCSPVAEMLLVSLVAIRMSWASLVVGVRT